MQIVTPGYPQFARLGYWLFLTLLLNKVVAPSNDFIFRNFFTFYLLLIAIVVAHFYYYARNAVTYLIETQGRVNEPIVLTIAVIYRIPKISIGNIRYLNPENKFVLGRDRDYVFTIGKPTLKELTILRTPEPYVFGKASQYRFNVFLDGELVPDDRIRKVDN